MDGPYREPKPLSEVIPSDRRRVRAAALVLVSMIAGAALLQLAHWAKEERAATATTEGYVAWLEKNDGGSLPVVAQEADSITTLTADEVQRVVAAHRVAVKRVCWDKESAPARVASAKVTLNLIVGAKGNVVSASATGTDALVASCVEDQARGWIFPAHTERSASVQIPFVFARN